MRVADDTFQRNPECQWVNDAIPWVNRLRCKGIDDNVLVVNGVICESNSLEECVKLHNGLIKMLWEGMVKM